MWRNDIKCKYIFMFTLNNLARKALNVFLVKLCWHCWMSMPNIFIVFSHLVMLTLYAAWHITPVVIPYWSGSDPLYAAINNVLRSDGAHWQTRDRGAGLGRRMGHQVLYMVSHKIGFYCALFRYCYKLLFSGSMYIFIRILQGCFTSIGTII